MQVLFGKISWFLLALILISRPLAELSGWTPLLRGLKYRRYLGWACGIAALIHGSLFISENRTGFALLLSDFRSYVFWGLAALAVLMVPLLTSNGFSRVILKGRWKLLQKFAYLAFISAAIHVFLIKKEWDALALPIIWGSLWILAWKKRRKFNANGAK